MVYFDNAATTYPKPECVYHEMDSFYRSHGGSAGRGTHEGAKSAGMLIAETRDRLKFLFHAPNHEVIFTPTATLALNMIIQGMIKAGARNIYISPFEHNAVTRVLHALAKEYTLSVHQLKVRDDLAYDMERIRYQFDEQAPDFVIVSHASNVIGLIAPAPDIFSLAKKYQACTLLDMSQTAGLVDIDIQRSDCDFAVFAGHKTLYGPTGISGFLMKPEISLPPVLFGGTGVASAEQDMPQNLPARYEMGTMNISGVAGLHAALGWLLETGIDNIRKREHANRQQLLEILEGYDFLQLVGVNPEREYIGVVSALIDGISSDSAGPLFDEHDIAIRTGLQCAPLAHKFLGTFPAGTLRFSISYFTTERVFEALKSVLDEIEEDI